PTPASTKRASRRFGCWSCSWHWKTNLASKFRTTNLWPRGHRGKSVGLSINSEKNKWHDENSYSATPRAGDGHDARGNRETSRSPERLLAESRHLAGRLKTHV